MAARFGFKVSKGVLSTISPPIPTAYEWASRYSPTPSKPLLDMSQGVPGVPPPHFLRQAIGKASSSPDSFGYCRWDGEPRLRKALVEEIKVAYGRDADVEVEDVALTAGCNLAFVAVAMSVADAGDEVILPVPWYFNHQMDLNLLGIKTVALRTLPGDGFIPSIERCKTLISPKTKAIVLVTPNNPTGATYPPALITSFARLATDHGLALIIDETYRDFINAGSPPHQLFTSPNSWRSTFIHLFSFSKSYCLPGHRLGAIAASPTFLNSVKTVLDCLQICPPRPVQMALSTLLPSLRPFVLENSLAVQSRHALFKELLPAGWTVGAQGGYFAFVRHPFARVRARNLCRKLAEEVGVVTLPATFFTQETRGGDELDEGPLELGWVVEEDTVEEEERWVRFSVANVDDEKVRRVCERLAALLPPLSDTR